VFSQASLRILITVTASGIGQNNKNNSMIQSPSELSSYMEYGGSIKASKDLY
jgi:hypothetical protein